MAVGITVYGQARDPQTGMIIVLSILIFVSLFFVVSYLITELIKKLNQIKRNTNQIQEIKKALNNIEDKIDYIKSASKLDARISYIEKNLK
ncbi:hypothetical protein CMI42_05305 [Candidatus Pacearchaeota archaeon]|nr:hypothetical protein [Candidatus Pacearchaeota archaeon]